LTLLTVVNKENLICDLIRRKIKLFLEPNKTLLLSFFGFEFDYKMEEEFLDFVINKFPVRFKKTFLCA